MYDEMIILIIEGIAGHTRNLPSNHGVIVIPLE